MKTKVIPHPYPRRTNDISAPDIYGTVYEDYIEWEKAVDILKSDQVGIIILRKEYVYALYEEVYTLETRKESIRVTKTLITKSDINVELN